MRNLVLLTLLVASLPAAAKPWNGIEPGISKRDDVVKKFGEPSRTVTQDGKEILAYLDKEAIKGTSQAQFKVDPTSKLVERIDVFPGPVVDKEAVESTYGAACPSGKLPPNSPPCFSKKLTDDFRTYYLYPKLGLAIFFNEDGKTVHSFIFTSLKAAN